MTTDYRALCIELVAELECWRPLQEVPDCLARARAALAEPQPPATGEAGELVEWLRNHELDELSNYDWEALRTRAADLLERLAQDHLPSTTKMVEPTDEELLNVFSAYGDFVEQEDGFGIWAISRSDWPQSARAVLARFGNHPAIPDSSPQPIPVTERLPEAGDCDAEERCWWWYAPVPEKTYGYWTHEDNATDRALDEWPTHWLPVHALPLPNADAL